MALIDLDKEARANLPAGTRLAANYKDVRYVCTIGRDESDKPTYTLEHTGELFHSPSRAGTQVMGGQTACNGWRFWNFESDLKEKAAAEPRAQKTVKEKPPKPAKAVKAPRRSAKAKAVITVVRNKKGAGEGEGRYMCSECGEPFFAREVSGGGVPDSCPEGHLAYTDEDGNVQYRESVEVVSEEEFEENIDLTPLAPTDDIFGTVEDVEPEPAL